MGTEGHWTIGPERGRLEIHTTREGVLSRMGHDLTIEAERFSGEVHVEAAEGGALEARVTVEVDARSLVVRAPDDLDAKDRAEIQGHIQADVLGTDRRPAVWFRATGIALPDGVADGDREVRGILELHGREKPLTLRVRHRVTATGIHLEGAGGFEQSDYGIRPFRAPLGVLKVADHVRVSFVLDLEGRP